MFQRFENTRDAGKLREMAAGLKQPYAAQAHVADGKLTLQQVDQWHAASDDIAPANLRQRCDAQFSRHGVEGFRFDQAHRFVGSVERLP